MNELLPGLVHWTAMHPGIEMQVSSHYYEPAAALFDPLEPDSGLGFLENRTRPERIVLTCRHHLRDSVELSQHFHATVHCNELGLHEFEGSGVQVKGFRTGDSVAPGVQALQMGSLAPDDTTMFLDVPGGALLFADALLHYGDEVSFVPDSLMGDDPEADKRGMLDSMEALLEREADTLLFAHGAPIVGGGHEVLRRFVEAHR
jgi:glyoxylase-like metal-dependent hydrolase (beta-lactamase superfamily II)